MSAQRLSPRFPPCDQCLHRKVRCDKTLPLCYRCSDASLACTREVVRRRPGRKRGSGAVISKLRSPSTTEREEWIDSSANPSIGINHDGELHGTRTLSFNDSSGTGALGACQVSPNSPSTDQYPISHVTGNQSHETYSIVVPSTSRTPERTRSSSVGELQSILANIATLSHHVGLFYSKLYPIWPIIPETALRSSLANPSALDPTQICLILSICALAVLHIPGSIAPSTEPRKVIAQQYVKQCRQLRSTFDYIESATIVTVQTSLFLSCAEVEFQRARSSWFLLRESIMLAQDLGFYEPANYSPSLSGSDILSIQRTLYLLSLVERGLTVLRNKPFAIVMFDSPPPSRFDDEDPRILNGLQSLSRLFKLLDKLFLDTWVGVTDAHGVIGSPASSQSSNTSPERADILAAQQILTEMSFKEQDFTDVQKADLLITQQWLRLVFWQAAMKQGLLSGKATEEELRYDFPRTIARSLCEVLGEIDREAIFIHGMAIFERIFEITYSFIDVLSLSHSISSGLEELGVLFKVLRESPNSHNTYIQILKAKLDGEAKDDG